MLVWLPCSVTGRGTPEPGLEELLLVEAEVEEEAVGGGTPEG
jgi:hypothetical protein